MKNKQKAEAILELQNWLLKWTKNCYIQGGFPCNTCTYYLLKELGVTSNKAYGMWLAILDIREPAYNKKVSEKLAMKVFNKKK